MPLLTTSTIGLGLAGTSIFLLRRRISRNWIDLRKKEYDHLSGKTILITGGNVGLGFEGAKEFARRNANVIIACRNTTKGEEAVASISKATGNESVSCVKLDLASLESVKTFISEIQSKYSAVDVLILNAGVWIPMEKGAKTEDGYEIHFGVNHLSHHLIAKSLLPQLEKSSMDGGGRLIFVSSSLMKSGRTDDLHTATYSGRVLKDEDGNPKKSFSPVGYCDSKLMNALTCKHMATILPENVSTYSLCPGFCRSSLSRNVTMPFHQKILATPIMLMIQRTQLQGAQNIVFVAAERNLVSGALYRDGEIMEKEMKHLDSVGGNAEAKRLWDWSEGLLRD